LQENEQRLKHVPDALMPLEVKEEMLKMKVGIMRRMLRNQQQIIKMSKMDRIELLDYKRQNDLQFF
jgi:hypothetical protein